MIAHLLTPTWVDLHNLSKHYDSQHLGYGDVFADRVAEFVARVLDEESAARGERGWNTPDLFLQCLPTHEDFVIATTANHLEFRFVDVG